MENKINLTDLLVKYQTSKEKSSTQEIADNQKVKIQGKIRILQQK